MRVQSVRLGHACNSSSSHSLIFLPGGGTDDLADAYPGRYGWENFTLRSPTAKKDYFATQLVEALGESQQAITIAEELTGRPLPGPPSDIYVDHESRWHWPRKHGSDEPHMDFVRDFMEYLMQDGIVVLGGNDNSAGHPLAHNNTRNFIPHLGSRNAGSVARYQDGLWALYNQHTGAKVRVSFDMPAGVQPDDHAVQTASFKPTTPELVDLKITDHCPFDCAFCHMGSTRDGEHADGLLDIVDVLADMQVFEVAIGGGEPTLHPQFAELVQALHAADVVPNFTTKNLAWLRGPTADAVLSRVGAFAYSVETAADVKALRKEMATHSMPFGTSKVHVQVVEGVPSEQELRDILAEAYDARFTATILGYKTTGRGATYEATKHSYDWLQVALDMHRKSTLPRLNIDTVLAARAEPKLEQAGVSPYLYSTREGQHSMFVDAVGRRIGPSSFCGEREYVPYTDGALADAIDEQFKHW